MADGFLLEAREIGRLSKAAWAAIRSELRTDDPEDVSLPLIAASLVHAMAVALRALEHFHPEVDPAELANAVLAQRTRYRLAKLDG